MCICAQWDTESASETEIGEFEFSVSVDEQILRFQIAMKDTVCVKVVDAFD